MWSACLAAEGVDDLCVAGDVLFFTARHEDFARHMAETGGEVPDVLVLAAPGLPTYALKIDPERDKQQFAESLAVARRLRERYLQEAGVELRK